MKGDQIAFQWGEIRQVVQKLQPFEGWETKKLTLARNFSHTLQTTAGTKILRNHKEMCKTKF